MEIREQFVLTVLRFDIWNVLFVNGTLEIALITEFLCLIPSLIHYTPTLYHLAHIQT